MTIKYRPISLTSVVAKNNGNHYKKLMLGYLIIQNTQIHLYCFVNKWTKSPDEKDPVDTI